MKPIERKDRDPVPIERISSGGIILNESKRVLLILRRSTGELLIPNGEVLPEESLEDAAIREVREETGYDTRIIRPIDSSEYTYVWEDGKAYQKKEHHFLLTLESKEAKPKREPHEDYINKWLSIGNAIKQATYPDAKACLQALASSLEISL